MARWPCCGNVTASGRCCSREGPRCSRRCSNAGLVDELFLSISPLLAGGDEPWLLEGSALDQPLKLEIVSVLEEGSYLYLRYRLSTIRR